MIFTAPILRCSACPRLAQRLLALIVLATTVVGCGSNSNAPSDGGVEDGVSSDAGCIPVATGTGVHFAAVYSNLIAHRCGAPSSCHFDTASPSAGLNMSSEGTAKASLVGIRAATSGFCTPANVDMRVAPNDPDHSMIWRRVSGTSCAERMPLGGPYLSCQDQNLIRDWILSGAE